MTIEWYKYPTAVYQKEDNVTCKRRAVSLTSLYLAGKELHQKCRMIETRKNVPEPMLEINKIIKNLTTIYDEMSPYGRT